MAVAVGAAVMVLPSTTAAADPANCDGVLVVIDGRAAGGELTVKCATGAPKTGLDALTAAGFSYTFVPRIPGMVCQIGGLPDPCNNAPANAYWAYWQRDPQGEWRYATEGAGTYRPAVGGSEGWMFGAGGNAPDVTFTPVNTDPAPPTSTDTVPSASQRQATPDAAAVRPDTATGDADVTDVNDQQLADRNAASQAETFDGQASETVEQTAEPQGFLDRFREEPRQLVGLMLVIIGVVALITAQRNRTKRPDQ
jgi:hypothetical protein